jgi:hypothetical protein
VSVEALSDLYRYLIEPLVPWFLAACVLFAAACVVLDLTRATGAGRGRVATLALVVLLILFARIGFAADSVAATGLVLSAHAVALFGLARWSWAASPPHERKAPLWSGLAIIALSLAAKCVDLEGWPPDLNSYSAWTGYEGLRTLEGDWPRDLFRGREFCLMNGGFSPLMLPLLHVTMRIFGGTAFAVRFAEVAGSTALLIVLWLWLRERLRGGWGPVALAVFAFSPWHLAQSRMGTYFSISAAVAVALLWTGDRVARDPRAASSWWLGFGVCTALIGYAYAPVKVLYAFALLVFAAGARSRRRAGGRGWWRAPFLAAAAVVVMLAVQLWDVTRFGEMFRYDFGHLATDTSIWHKTPDDRVTRERQPPAVITENFFRNAGEWTRQVYAERNILRWYAPALTLAALAAVITLVRGLEWVLPVYFMIGLLPPLITYPLERRSLIAWPLAYVFGVVFARELARGTAGLLASRWWRATCHTAVAAGLVASSLHGLHVFATTNSVVLDWPYFGPDHQGVMFDEAERLLAAHHLVFVNLDNPLVPVVEVKLFEPARRLGRLTSWDYIDLEEDAEDLPELPRDERLCFLYLVEDGRDDIMQTVRRLLPGGTLIRRFADDAELMFSMYVVGDMHTAHPVILSPCHPEPLSS